MLENLDNYERKIYSQNGEDGIIQAIFQKIGITNKFCVEFGVGDGSECNTRYLIEEEKWLYLHMDTIDQTLAQTRVRTEFITSANVNSLFKKYNVPEQFDLLSIDIDYNTYWVWRALEGYRPRLVIVEYNASFAPTESFAVKYDPEGVWDGTNYFGASLLAFVKLGKSKGYTLLGCETIGANAFFLRNDLLAHAQFTSKDIEQLYRAPRYGQLIDGVYIGHPRSNREFVQV